ncbi:hypothetical protein DMN91_003720 [Ooceraea biroi]|uniref:Reverse transcriptase domain-containing protein n=1 Tax=Ooceraea biroi TaxID=2015173 RepID=A0A3L8DSV0_OOCBI|nr:hypothetical protein DMN91_003720 [Ooceraea biroi]
MGSPLPPILADTVMEDLELYCIGQLGFGLLIFYRYVDDIFTILPNDEVQHVIDVFNSYHPRLKFTCETEIDDGLSFLDTTVIRDGGRLVTNWYRKPTFSGRYISFLSNHPDKQKVGVIKSLVDRALLLSDPRFHTSNINVVKEILMNNCYPVEVIDRLKRE